ncbi:hypothetical protein JCM16775_2455 [Leptotrichia hofstadii]|jgi:hypothetical protein|uniref:Uncharacterized protein n=1 Tax=Leptotrichia hofstadii TaxID=157688 RepID=A0A510JK71_9FUSO|nr:hypothetical protein JCM16775_2455 [Leptotrichia hofstadii]
MKENLIKILLTVLFTVIYFFLQQKLSIIFLLLWIEILVSFGKSIVVALISMLIIIMFFFYFGYLSRNFLVKLNKILLGVLMSIILIYFLYNIFYQENQFIPGIEEFNITYIILHISYTIGLFLDKKIIIKHKN